MSTMRPDLQLWLLGCASVLLVSGCDTVPLDALKMSPQSIEHRQLQTRRFDGTDDQKILAASAGVLQDLGFTIDESETKLGVIVASKDRSAWSASQALGAWAVSMLGVNEGVDNVQKIRVSLVARPANSDLTPQDARAFLVRVTFQRTIWDTYGQVKTVEGIDDAQIYQEFFDRLSKSLFLVANQI